MTSFGPYLRQLRETRRYSLRQVQREAGISPGYLSLIEQGKRGVPHLSLLQRLAQVYGVSVSELLTKAGVGEGELPAPTRSYRVELLWPERLEEAINAIAAEGWALHTLQGDFSTDSDGWKAWKFLTVWERAFAAPGPRKQAESDE